MGLPDTPLWPHTGAILAGGESRRMGQRKEGLRLWDQRPMMAYVLEAMAAVCSRVVIVGCCEGFSVETTETLLTLQDIHPGKGPLSGLETLLASNLDSHYLVVSCDQPLLHPETLHQLVAGGPHGLRFFHGPHGKNLDPFPGVYPAEMLPAIQQAMTAKTYGLRTLIKRYQSTWVPLEAGAVVQLTNVNTPEEFQALLQKHDPAPWLFNAKNSTV